MTAEMAIMNKAAVALAADSAVTISGPAVNGRPGFQKIYGNANKLFELIKGRPVGFMIYDNAEFMHVPWETVVKTYRSEHRAVVFDTIDGYVQDFCGWLNDGLGRLVSSEVRASYLSFCIATISEQIITRSEMRMQHRIAALERPARVSNAMRRQILRESLEELEEEFAGDPADDWATGLDEAQLLLRYPDLIESVPERFQRYALTRTERKRILAVAWTLLLRSYTPTQTGIVLAGFGEHEIFPSLVHLQVGGVVADRLVAHSHDKLCVTPSQPSIITGFAQTTEAVTFLTGIDPMVKELIEAFWLEWFDRFGHDAHQLVEKDVPDLPTETIRSIARRFERYGKAWWSRFAKYMDRVHQELRYGPIEASAAFLSKGELAGLAENLVDLASLRNRVSIDREETVGGATDVCVISPGDGFVWIKRKHYFDLSFNPAWPQRQLTDGVRSIMKADEEGGLE